MDTDRLNTMLHKKEYDAIWEHLSSQKDDCCECWSKDEKLDFWLSFLERRSYEESGKHGILGLAGSFQGARLIFDMFKKLCQRLEWWPEMNANVLLTYMLANGITSQELIRTIYAYCLDYKYVLDRIKGNCEPRDCFCYAEDYIKELLGKWNERRSRVGDEKICFITCYNNDAELSEMNAWIDRLKVPLGITVERRAIKGAKSMCAGYNEAMHSSDAKYKVYLHQDIRILNPWFIYKVIDCFDRNPRAGLIGMFGAESVPESGVMWNAKRYGAVIHSEFSDDHIADTFDEKVLCDGDFKAALVDGFLMATCADIEWREDVFKGWDFYDVSQSMEFTRKGYEIIVPRQEQTWCLHDFGKISWEGYEEARQLFVDTYLNDAHSNSMKGDKAEMNSVKERLQELIAAGETDKAYALITENLRGEIEALKNDPQYCVLAATAYMGKEQLSRAFDIITMGLISDNRNYELYLTLGEYYGRTNLNQALLCFYQALHYCDIEEDRQIIESYIESVVSQGASIRQVSFVIVARNQSEYLKRCLDSIVTTIMPGLYEIVVVDDASTDGTWEWLSEIEGITSCLTDEDMGYVKACNQGIKLANAFNDVFLLDADAVLLDNSLFYLMLGRYLGDNVGVIGGITNEFIIDQKMYIDTSNMNEAIKLAATVNCPMSDAYEKAIYVSDHAMLINRDAIDRAGMLDEVFSPDLYEDKDFCVRVNMSGMEVLLCFNSYIFKTMDRHTIYGSEEKLTEENRERFVKKWDCNIDYSNNARTGIIELISADKEKPIEVLELGCAMGSTLNRIKRLWHNAEVHGVEYVGSVARIGGKITDVIQGDVESMGIPYTRKQFDYIICADVLEHLREPQATLERFTPYLKDDGFFIISLPNIRHYAVIMMLMRDGRFDYADSGILDATHLKFFTRDTAKEMIESAGLKVLSIQRNYNGHPEDNEFITKISEAFDVIDPEELKVFQYYFVAAKM